MFATELAALQSRFSLSAEVLAEFASLLARATEEGQATRILDTRAVLDAATRVSLHGDAGGPLPASGTAPEWKEDPSRRYEDLDHRLGVGGMGEVRRVLDRSLRRPLAMKIIRSELLDDPAEVARFVEEAQCAAQLQHPGIVPVHELGVLADGRPFFTMREVRGRTLGEVIREVHAASTDRWTAGPSGWTIRRLIDAFRRVCETMAYAHERGVVHRDLKPANVMLGAYGEVLVLDWGLAKVRGLQGRPAPTGEAELVVTDRSRDGTHATLYGTVAGTPSFMSPEQARGEIDEIDARSDVYALGAILYRILSGRLPYGSRHPQAVLAALLSGPPEPLAPGPDGLPLPEELVAACERAMAYEPADRYADATQLAEEITAWLEGAKAREKALAVVEEAQAMGPESSRLRQRAAALRSESERALEPIPLWETEERKAPAWAAADEAADLERKADALELQATQTLFAALTHAPGLPEAHAALAERYREEHAVAEAARQIEGKARSETLLTTHTNALPESHEVRKRCVAYLRGTGALTLVTEPPGAEVLLHRYEVTNRRLVPVFERSLGTTPLAEVPVEKGSYLCFIRHPHHPDTRYPVLIERQAHWDGVPPGSAEPFPIRLPGKGELGPDDMFIPAGWFWSGGDPEVADAMPRRRLWCPDLVLKRFPVTNREYIAFLDDLVAEGREEEALRWVPRERAGKEHEEGAMIYGRRPDGRFELVPDADGDLWLPDFPVCMVDWWCAHAYAGWLAAKTCQPDRRTAWRLPSELEWEKAARGVDGRFFPWGDVPDPSWCSMRDSHQGRLLPRVVDSFPVDESPYGIRGLGGNMRDWCANLFDKAGPPATGDTVDEPDVGEITSRARRALRGGAWDGYARDSRSAYRGAYDTWSRVPSLGFRVARTLRSLQQA